MLRSRVAIDPAELGRDAEGGHDRVFLPAGAKAAEVLAKYIIVDMYAKAVQGMSAEDAVKWADGEVRKVYG